jgi:hypothetical protein
MNGIQLGREAPPLALWRIDGYEESGSSAGSMTVLAITTGDVPDPDAALTEVCSNGEWLAVHAIRLIASAADLADLATYIDTVANLTGFEMSPEIALAVAENIIRSVQDYASMLDYIRDHTKPLVIQAHGE